MGVAEVGARGGKKVTSVVAPQGKESVYSFAYHLCALDICRDNLIFHGIKDGQSFEIACVEHVVCTCSG